MGSPRPVVDLPNDAPALAALVRDLAPELAVVARPDGSVLVAGEDYSLVFRRGASAWSYRARPDLAFPLGSRGEIAEEDKLATLLGPVLGLDPSTVANAEAPAAYLRLRSVDQRHDPEILARHEHHISLDVAEQAQRRRRRDDDGR